MMVSFQRAWTMRIRWLDPSYFTGGGGRPLMVASVMVVDGWMGNGRGGEGTKGRDGYMQDLHVTTAPVVRLELLAYSRRLGGISHPPPTEGGSPAVCLSCYFCIVWCGRWSCGACYSSDTSIRASPCPANPGYLDTTHHGSLDTTGPVTNQTQRDIRVHRDRNDAHRRFAARARSMA